jgi:hypothetical protein
MHNASFIAVCAAPQKTLVHCHVVGDRRPLHLVLDIVWNVFGLLRICHVVHQPDAGAGRFRTLEDQCTEQVSFLCVVGSSCQELDLRAGMAPRPSQ